MALMIFESVLADAVFHIWLCDRRGVRVATSTSGVEGPAAG